MTAITLNRPAAPLRRLLAACALLLAGLPAPGLAAGNGLDIFQTLGLAPAPAVPLAPPGPSQTTKMIEIAQVQGTVHAQSVQKVGELADRNPTETVSIIRQWLHEAA